VSAAGLRYSVIPGEWAVVRRAAAAPPPGWLDEAAGDFVSVTRTAEELSVVCPAAGVPETERAERGWALVKLHGPFPFAQVGVLASVAAPLAAAGVSLFALSTFDTDYLLVKRADLGAARRALAGAGHVEAAAESR